MATKKTDDGGAAEVQAKTDEAEEKGYIGSTPDPHPNEAYSLKSGPDSPSASDTLAALRKERDAK